LGWLTTHGSKKESIMTQASARQRQHVQIFTDGTCLGNPGPGGWAALLQGGGRERLLRDAEPHTTNNRMELKAVLEGLRALTTPCQVTITTDSRYVEGVLTLGWKRKTNLDLLTSFDDLLKIHTVSFVRVAGHAGHPENERVDTAARAEAERAKAQLQDPAYSLTAQIHERTTTYELHLRTLLATSAPGICTSKTSIPS
jgi:ribonuclease HI